MSRLLILSFFLFAATLQAQTISLSQQVLSSGGGGGQQAAYDVVWTIGEPVITTVSNNTRIVTQGFHQPDLLNAVSTKELDILTLHLELFPNPTPDIFTIRYQATEKLQLMVQVFDVLGREVQSPLELQSPERQIIDSSNWPSGLYLVQLFDTVSKATATLRVVKL